MERDAFLEQNKVSVMVLCMRFSLVLEQRVSSLFSGLFKITEEVDNGNN